MDTQDEKIETVSLDDDLDIAPDSATSEGLVQPTHATSKMKTWPISILFIIANEFCERYVFSLII